MAAPEAKRAELRRLLEHGIATVHLDARRSGVRVPARFRNEGHLRLNLSFRFEKVEMLIDGRQIGATLSFAGEPYRCVLPWEAIFGVTQEGDGRVWQDDMPKDVVEVLSERVPVKQERHLRLVH